MRRLILLYTSGLGSGYIPFASGTWGTAVAVLLYLPMASLNRFPADGGRPTLYLAIVAVVSALGIWGANHAESVYKKKDPGEVVIDEIAGFFVTVFLIPTTVLWLLAAFFVFRALDVLKPYPIRKLESLPGGWGIMLDDILAGAFGCVLLHGAGWILRAMG